MGEQARVGSVEAIESFRAALLVYISKARALLEDSADEAARTRSWIEMDRLPYWENQVRRRKQALENAQHELFSAEMANLREPTTAERSAVQRARLSLREAEEKLKVVIRWKRGFDNQVQPILKQLEQFRTILANDLPRGVQFLDQAVRTLETYAGIARQGGIATDALRTERENEEDGAL